MIHHRRSIRLKGYDYSQAGLYFIAICMQDRKCLFGKILEGEMITRGARTALQVHSPPTVDGKAIIVKTWYPVYLSRNKNLFRLSF